MKITDINMWSVYTNMNNFRRVIGFKDDSDGSRLVQYERGYFGDKDGKWVGFGDKVWVKKRTLASWAFRKYGYVMPANVRTVYREELNTIEGKAEYRSAGEGEQGPAHGL